MVGFSALAGFALTVLWSAPFVDTVVGGAVTDTLLGPDAGTSAGAGVTAGLLFAFVSGLAGTITACNIAAFAAVAPVIRTGAGRWGAAKQALKPLGWLGSGMVGVAAVYGVVVGLIGTNMPQFSTVPVQPGIVSPRLGQAMVVFGVVGVVMLIMGLAALGLVPDPFGRISQRHPNAQVVIMGVLIGAFLIGRPFPLFRELFRDAAERGDPLYGAAAFACSPLRTSSSWPSSCWPSPWSRDIVSGAGPPLDRTGSPPSRPPVSSPRAPFVAVLGCPPAGDARRPPVVPGSPVGVICVGRSFVTAPARRGAR